MCVTLMEENFIVRTRKKITFEDVKGSCLQCHAKKKPRVKLLFFIYCYYLLIQYFSVGY